MLRKNKRAIELSINFIVMLVLGIAMFGSGLMFASKFFSKAEQIKGNLDSQTEKQIEKLLDSGSSTVIPISQKEIFRNKFDTFGIGVLAKLSGDYSMTVSQGDAFTKSKETISWNIADWDLQPGLTQKLTLEKNKKGKYMVGVTVPRTAEKGTYIFIVTISYTDPTNTNANLPEYDNPMQFFVKVP